MPYLRQTCIFMVYFFIQIIDFLHLADFEPLKPVSYTHLTLPTIA